MTDAAKNSHEKRTLTPTERSKLSYHRRKADHKFLRVMVKNETKEKLEAMVKSKGMTQMDFLEYLINREFELGKQG